MTKILRKNYKYGVVNDSSNREYPDFNPKYVGTFHGGDVINKQGISTFEDLIQRGSLDAFRAGKIYQFYEITTEEGGLVWKYEGQVPRQKTTPQGIGDTLEKTEQTPQNIAQPISNYGQSQTVKVMQETIDYLRNELSREKQLSESRINSIVKEANAKYETVMAENARLYERLKEADKQYKEVIDQKVSDAVKIADLNAEIIQIKRDNEHTQTTMQDNMVKMNDIREQEKEKGLLKIITNGITELTNSSPEVKEVLVEAIRGGPAIVSAIFSEGLKFFHGLNNNTPLELPQSPISQSNNTSYNHLTTL